MNALLKAVSIQMIITGRRRQVTAIALGLSRAQIACMPLLATVIEDE
jgi:hypothetical protein